MLSPESLCEATIAKNNEYKQKVDEYYEKLRRELDSVNAIIESVENLSDSSLQVEPDDKWCLHADGAYKPIGVIDMGDTLKPESPFYEEASCRERYLKFILPNPFSAAERRYLEKAIVKENKRLMALRLQQSGQNPLEALPADNEAYLDNMEGLDWAAIARDVVSTWNHPGDPRTPQECQSRWLAQHPKLNYEAWSDEETKKLQEIVQDLRASDSLDWSTVAETLKTDRTALDCIRQYQACNKSTFKWTDELDKKLLAAVEKYGYSNWVLVAPAVSLELSPNQCQIRYERTLNPALKHGKFTPEEDEMLLKAIEFHGFEWRKVAQMIPGRSNTQCRSRYLSLGRQKERQAKKVDKLDTPKTTPPPTPPTATANGVETSAEMEETLHAPTITDIPENQPKKGPKARPVTKAGNSSKPTHPMRTRSSGNPV